MSNKQQFIALETKKRGKGVFVVIGMDMVARSRKAAFASFQKYGEMMPDMVIIEKEANEMLDKLNIMLKPRKWTKKLEKEYVKKLQAAEAKSRTKKG
jgi:hypothetical protein